MFAAHNRHAQQTRAKLGRYTALNRRFSAYTKRCSPDVFLKMGGVHRELAATERRIDSFIDALRREELREVECGREVEGFSRVPYDLLLIWR